VEAKVEDGDGHAFHYHTTGGTIEGPFTRSGEPC
jgi:hypothetical protein